MQRSLGSLVVLLGLAGATAGCGPVNAGSAFAAQMEPFLEGRAGIVGQVVAPENSLPFSGSARVVVDLDPAYTPDQVVQETVAIMTHRVDDPVGYDLTVRFSSPAGDGTDAVAGLHVRVPEPARDDEALRDDVTESVERGAALVALGEGETVLQPDRITSELVTEADALEVWTVLCEDPTLLEGVGPVEVVTGSVDLEPGDLVVHPASTTAQVEGGPGKSCSRIADLADVVTQARELGTVDEYRAEAYATGPHDPDLSITFVEPPQDLAALTQRAVEVGVDLVVGP